VVLGGGYKRKELTYNDWNIGSDIDLFIFSNFIPFFWRKLIKIQNEINQNEFFFHYRGVIPWYLPKSRTFWAYKLKQEGIVLKGNKNILQKIQARENNILPRESFRVLIRNLGTWLSNAETPQSILRSYLNIGEGCLTFFGYLKPSYQERMEEFCCKKSEFGLDNNLIEKITLGYLTKTNYPKVKKILDSKEVNLSVDLAIKDCLSVLDNLLSIYLRKYYNCHDEFSIDEKIDVISREISVKPLLNFVFYFFLKRKRISMQPRFIPIIFQFKITDLWKITIYHFLGKSQERNRLLAKYFKGEKEFEFFSNSALIKIYESHPSYTLIEID